MLKYLLLVFIGFSGKKNYLRFCFHQIKYNPSSTITHICDVPHEKGLLANLPVNYQYLIYWEITG